VEIEGALGGSIVSGVGTGCPERALVDEI